MRLFTAAKALLRVKKFKESDLNSQRNLLLQEIEHKSSDGNIFYVVDQEALRIKMDESDWKYFEDLGYKVIRPERNIFIPHGSQYPSKDAWEEVSFGIISWGEGSK